jgi:NAD+ dependent glucose-6-phosphate dehydrogenase
MIRRILVTGAAGFVGGLVYRHFAFDTKNYQTFALDRTEMPSSRVPSGTELRFSAGSFFCEDLAVSDRLNESFQGIDVIVHLAGEPRVDATEEAAARNNVTATRRLYEAASRVGVRKIIFASTSLVMAGYESQEPFRSIREGRRKGMPLFARRLTHEMPPRPLNDYAASKLRCEGIALDYADRFKLSSLCIRIGAVTPDDVPPPDPTWRPWWCSQRDVTGIFEKAARCDGPPFDVFFAVSQNRSRWVDLSHARKILASFPGTARLD